MLVWASLVSRWNDAHSVLLFLRGGYSLQTDSGWSFQVRFRRRLITILSKNVSCDSRWWSFAVYTSEFLRMIQVFLELSRFCQENIHGNRNSDKYPGMVRRPLNRVGSAYGVVCGQSWDDQLCNQSRSAGSF